MTDPDRLLKTYIERFEAGGSADPSDLLDQLEGRDRERLRALVGGYLEHAAPAQRWDAKAFEGSLAARASARVEESWRAESAALPKLLVERRKQAKLQRKALVERLADWLGHPDQEPKVARYYNALEHGWLAPAGVNERVFEGLAKLLGTSAEALRKAGESVAPSAGGEPAEVWARMASPPKPADREASDTEEIESTPLEITEDWDEVDRLFRAG